MCGGEKGGKITWQQNSLKMTFVSEQNRNTVTFYVLKGTSDDELSLNHDLSISASRTTPAHGMY